LRPAGYSSSLQIDELLQKHESTWLAGVGAFVVVGVAVPGFYPLVKGLVLGNYTLASFVPYYAAILPLCGLFAGSFVFGATRFVLANRIEEKIRTWRFGMRGEQAVGERLGSADIASWAFAVFNDVPGDGNWNIDHVVISPAGIFVLETKARPRRKATIDQPEHEVRYDGAKLQFPWCYDTDASKQARRNAEWVQKFVKEFVPAGLPIQPVIVLPGWYVSSEGNYPVKAMNADYLVKYLRSSKSRFSRDELRAVICRFEERCRSLEF